MIEKQMLRLMLNKNFYTQYRGAISQARFDLAPATEDRFAFTLVFSSELRKSGT